MYLHPSVCLSRVPYNVAATGANVFIHIYLHLQINNYLKYLSYDRFQWKIVFTSVVQWGL